MISPNTRPLYRGGLVLAISAVLILAPFGAPIGRTAGSADTEAGQILASELAAGLTLSTANTTQIIEATRRAVHRSPVLASNIIRMAILSKTPPRHQRKGGEEITCQFVAGLARAAILSAPGQASKVVEEASGLCPDSSAELSALLSESTLGLSAAAEDLYGPLGNGFGFGPGFPGSPGFARRRPGGVVSLAPPMNFPF